MHIGGGLKGMSCGTLWNTKSQECGRPRVFGVTQMSLASPIYTSFKDVIGDFVLMRKETYYYKSTYWS